jgi:divinyl protochlorophyllide a 8-vinyl-reductase
VRSAEQALIGPNAIIQMAEALCAWMGPVNTRTLMDAVQLGAYLDRPPKNMVPQTEVAALHTEVYRQLDLAAFKRVSADAGKRTGDYLLANRIPKPVQWLLKRLPDRLAASILSRAIAKHAWTFAGSGVFGYGWQPQLVYSIKGNPITAGLHTEVPVCDYYAATFERIFRVLVNDDWRAVEFACEASGAEACRFEICAPEDASAVASAAGATALP